MLNTKITSGAHVEDKTYDREVTIKKLRKMGVFDREDISSDEDSDFYDDSSWD